MIILDCGVGFPDLEMPGVDLVIPDFSYVVKNRHKLKELCCHKVTKIISVRFHFF